MGEESVVLLCKLMRCMNKDSLAAVKPMAVESVVVPPGGSCARLKNVAACDVCDLLLCCGKWVRRVLCCHASRVMCA